MDNEALTHESIDSQEAPLIDAMNDNDDFVIDLRDSTLLHNSNIAEQYSQLMELEDGLNKSQDNPYALFDDEASTSRFGLGGR